MKSTKPTHAEKLLRLAHIDVFSSVLGTLPTMIVVLAILGNSTATDIWLQGQAVHMRIFEQYSWGASMAFVTFAWPFYAGMLLGLAVWLTLRVLFFFKYRI